MRANLLQRLTEPIHDRIQSRAPTSSRYSSFRDRERSLDPGRLRKALRHSRVNGASPSGSDLKRGNLFLAFRLHTSPSTRISPGKPVFQRTSGSPDQTYLDPRCSDVDNNTRILNTCTRLWLTQSEQATPVNSIKDVVRSSV